MAQPMQHGFEPAPQPLQGPVDPVAHEAAWARVDGLNNDPTRASELPRLEVVRLAEVALAPVTEVGDGYTTEDINAEVGFSNTFTMNNLEEALARPVSEEAVPVVGAAEATDQVAHVVSLAARVRKARQEGGLAGHQSKGPIGVGVMNNHPVDMSDEAVARRRAARLVWEQRQQVRGNQ